MALFAVFLAVVALAAVLAFGSARSGESGDDAGAAVAATPRQARGGATPTNTPTPMPSPTPSPVATTGGASLLSSPSAIAAYCAKAGTEGFRIAGETKVLTIQPGALVIWRCWDGKALGCAATQESYFDCDVVNESTTPGQAIGAYCARHPGSAPLPGEIPLHAWSWSCDNRGNPALGARSIPANAIDGLGYLYATWDTLDKAIATAKSSAFR